MDGARVAIQGFGNVGSAAAELFAGNGSRIVAVQDRTGTVYNPDGLDIAGLMAQLREHGSIGGFTGGERIPDEEFWDVESDFLVPAALEGQITAARARRVKTRVVLEGANGPTLTEADAVFAKRGITVVPDVMANAGA